MKKSPDPGIFSRAHGTKTGPGPCMLEMAVSYFHTNFDFIFCFEIYYHESFDYLIKKLPCFIYNLYNFV